MDKIENHLGLAHDLAFDYARKTGLDKDELLSYAFEGLIKAHRRFDPNKGYKFSSYATRWIKGSLARYFRDTTQVPRKIQELYFKTNKLTKQGKIDSVICEKLNITEEQLINCRLLMKHYYYRKGLEIELKPFNTATIYLPDFNQLTECFRDIKKTDKNYDKLSNEAKERILYLRNERYFSFRRIGEEVGFDSQKVYRFYKKAEKNYKLFGHWKYL